MLKKRDLLLIGGLLVLLGGVVAGASWLQSMKVVIPYSITMSIKGDAATSRAFTWYTESSGGTAVVQVVAETDADGWESDHMMEFIAESVTAVEEGNEQASTVHKAHAEGLQPGTRYLYRVGSKDSNSWSGAAVFMTESEDEDTPFQFIYVTDSQGELEADFDLWGHTVAAAFKQFPDARFIVHAGDVVEHADDQEAWSYFFDKAAQWLMSVPLMPATGNHDEVNGNAAAFASHFHVPDNGAEGSQPGTTYSFEYGNALFIYLNSESNIDGQTAWLKQQLKQADQEWIIAVMHEGPYGGKRKKNLKDWVALFDEYKVDLVLQGHNHEYSRSYPLRDDEIAPIGPDNVVYDRAGTVYAVANTSGQKFNEKKEDLFYHAVHFQNEKQMFAGITINGKQLIYEAYDVDGNKLDEIVLQHR